MPNVRALPEVAPLRLAAQRLIGPGFETAADAVRWMTALQAQDYPGALTSVALRMKSGARQQVETALDAGEVVRSWPMRGTLHLVAAEDLPWILSLTAARLVAGAATRRKQLGLDEGTLERARELAVTSLEGGRRLRRDDLLTVWSDAGVQTQGGRGYHMLWFLAQTGTLCFGPVSDGQQQLVLVEEWIRQPRHLQWDEALGELALRYFRSHGPATVKDFTRWTGLVAADVRTGLALARTRLAHFELDGVEYFLDPGTPEVLRVASESASSAGSRGRTAGEVLLLPGFDEFILGYQDRRAQLPAEFADRIVPGGNGVFKPTVVSAGQVVGTWARRGRGAKQEVAGTPFTSFSVDVAAAIPEVYAALP